MRNGKNYGQKLCELDYMPQVNVKKVKGNTAEAVAEVAKYSD